MTEPISEDRLSEIRARMDEWRNGVAAWPYFVEATAELLDEIDRLRAEKGTP